MHRALASGRNAWPSVSNSVLCCRLSPVRPHQAAALHAQVDAPARAVERAPAAGWRRPARGRRGRPGRSPRTAAGPASARAAAPRRRAGILRDARRRRVDSSAARSRVRVIGAPSCEPAGWLQLKRGRQWRSIERHDASPCSAMPARGEQRARSRPAADVRARARARPAIRRRRRGDRHARLGDHRPPSRSGVTKCTLAPCSRRRRPAAPARACAGP